MSRTSNGSRCPAGVNPEAADHVVPPGGDLPPNVGDAVAARQLLDGQDLVASLVGADINKAS